MESFDTMSMPYLTSPLGTMNPMQNGDYLGAMPPLDMPHQQSYDEPFVRYAA